MIQAIVYDAVGTLIHPDPPVATQYARVARRFGSRLGEDEIRRRFARAFATQDRLDEASSWRTSETRERERWQAIVAEVLDDVADSASCFDALFRAFGEARAWQLDADAGNVLQLVQQRGIRQAVASNFDRRLHDVLAAKPEFRYFEAVLVSSEVGWRKPAAPFFAAVADRLGLPPGVILFVGDDRVNDFEPARRAGMRGILLDPSQRHSDLEGDRIARLNHLPELF